MARVKLLSDAELDDKTREAVKALEARGADASTLRGLAHSQALFDEYFKFYIPARKGRDVAEELIELLRLRIARHNDCFT